MRFDEDQTKAILEELPGRCRKVTRILDKVGDRTGLKGNEAAQTAGTRAGRMPPFAFWSVLGFILVAFSKPLFEVAALALRTPVYSYILLIPFVTLYLLRVAPTHVVWNRSPKVLHSLVPLIVGLAILIVYVLSVRAGWKPSPDDRLASILMAMICLIYAVVAAFLNGASSRGFVLPLAMLVFMAPFPSALLHAIESFLQHSSADAAQVFFSLSGTPFVREDTFYRLPGISLMVAPECSGVRSTLALFLTSLVAAHLILRSRLHKTILVAVVLPLAIIRNAFRIFIIGQLCIHIGPHMIDSPIHHRGGPIFFALSLIPFLILLLYLRRREKLKSAGKSNSGLSRPQAIKS